MSVSVGEYLIRRLHALGVRHVFGVAGDFALTLDKMIVDMKLLQFVNMCNELNAGYAADGYARINGLGVVCTTYGVGELSALNAIAGAYAERVPVVKITGAPPRHAYEESLPLHHTLGDYDIPRRMYEHITVRAVTINDPNEAPREIDEALALCLFHQRPVYICLPCDVVRMPCYAPRDFGELNIDQMFPRLTRIDYSALDEAVAETVNMLKNATKPVVLLDVEIQRYGLQDIARALIEKTGYPFSTTMMGKTAIEEQHPQFIGLYMGLSSRDYVRKRVEEADVVLQLGWQETDLNTGGFTFKLEHARTITATHQWVRVKKHYYLQISLKEYIQALTEKLERDETKIKGYDIKPATEYAFHRASKPFDVQKGKDGQLKLCRFFDRLAQSIPPNCIVVAETGNALFGAAETLMPKGGSMIAQIFYGSIGFSLGAAIGVALAAPDRPVLLLIGDGAYQVVSPDHATIIRLGLKNLTMFVLNNDGYTIERFIQDGPFNDIPPVKYHRMPAVLGDDGEGDVVNTEEELDSLLKGRKDLFDASSRGTRAKLVEIKTDKMDGVETLVKAARLMRKRTSVHSA